MDELLIVLLQDMRESHEFKGKGFAEICDVMAGSAARSFGSEFVPAVFAQLKLFDFSGLRAFNADIGSLPDSRPAFVAAGTCLGEHMPEGSALVLDDGNPIMPGDLCMFSHRCEFYRSAKQYIGRWNSEYGMLAPNRPKVLGYLFYASNPRCFLIVYGSDFAGATRIGSFIKPDGEEVQCSPWSMLDHRDDAAFADLFTWADVDRTADLESTSIAAWSPIIEENKRDLSEWLWSRMTRDEQEEVSRAYENRVAA